MKGFFAALGVAAIRQARRADPNFEPIEYLKQERDIAFRDMEKTGDVDSYCYYQGKYEAYADALFQLGVDD